MFDLAQCMQEGKFTQFECTLKASEAFLEVHRQEEIESNRRKELDRQQKEDLILNGKKQSENNHIIGLYITGTILVVILVGLLIYWWFVHRRNREHRERFLRPAIPSRQPTECTVLGIEQPDGTLNGSLPTTVPLHQIHRDSRTTGQGYDPSAPDLGDTHSDPLIAKRNNVQMPGDQPPTYNDCIKNGM